MAESKLAVDPVTYWVMGPGGSLDIVHVSVDQKMAETHMKVKIELETLKSLGISVDQWNKALDSIKSQYSVKKAKTILSDL
jgi:hypothetical protein